MLESNKTGGAMRTYGVVAVAITSFVLGAASAHADEQKSPSWGGSGGTSGYNLDCGNTGVMVGITAKWGLWIDQLGVMCRTVKSNGQLGEFFTKGPVGGQGGDHSGSSKCRDGYVVTTAFGESGLYVDSFRANCKQWDPATRKPTGEAVQDVKIANVKSFTAYNSFSCEGSAVGKALRGKRGSYIDSLQFVCDLYNK